MNENILTFLRTNDSKNKLKINNLDSRNIININDKEFKVDCILNQKSQEEVFNIIERSVLSNVLKGYNCTVFAYGQTGSGKTYTIQGNEDFPGLVPRTLEYLHKNYKNIKMSFIEIYNENLMDLNNTNQSSLLTIRDDSEQGIIIDNLNLYNSENLEKSLEFYKMGILNRKTASTLMNDQSSRSHSIFTIYLEKEDSSIIRKSKLCFVDLAGSEKIKDICKDFVNDGDPNNSIIGISKFRETTNINKSLLCLGKIVHKLGTNDKWHISYRDSKLTFLLKDSLGGNCKLAIIGNVNLECQSDSISTLQFLSRTKMITNNPTINYELFDQNIKGILNSLEKENNELKRQLKAVHKTETLEYNLNKAKREILDMKNDISVLEKSLKELTNVFYEKNLVLLDIDQKIEKINSERKKCIKINIKK